MDTRLLLTLLFFIVYSLILARHAWQGQTRTKSLADYYVGGRAIGGTTIGLSFFATYSSTNSFVGFSGQAFTYGIAWMLLVPFIVGCSAFAWIAVAPRLREFSERLDSLTIPDFIGFRYESVPARFASALVVLFASCLYLTAVYKGIGNLLQASLQVPYSLAIAIVFVVVMAYTAVGGFISVVKTDAVQGGIMAVAAVILFIGVVSASGGLGSIEDVGQSADGARLFEWDTAMPLSLLLGVLFATTFKAAVEPRQLSRFYALKDRGAARRGMWISTVAFLLVYSLLTPIGLYARNILPSSIDDTDRVVPLIVTSPEVFGPVLGAFLLVAMVAAAMSSLDSVLLVMASTFQRDCLARILPATSDRGSIQRTRLWVGGFALVTAILALNPPGGIVYMTSLSGSLYASCFFPALVLGLYWRRGNGAAVLTSFAIGTLCLLLWRTISPWPALHPVFPALVLSTLGYLAVALSVSGRPPVVLESLFGVRHD